MYVGQLLVHFVPCCPVQLPYVKWSRWCDYLFERINDNDDDDDDDDDDDRINDDDINRKKDVHRVNVLMHLFGKKIAVLVKESVIYIILSAFAWRVAVVYEECC